MQFPKATNFDGKIHTFGIGLQALGTNFLQKYASLAKAASKKACAVLNRLNLG